MGDSETGCGVGVLTVAGGTLGVPRRLDVVSVVASLEATRRATKTSSATMALSIAAIMLIIANANRVRGVSQTAVKLQND